MRLRIPDAHKRPFKDLVLLDGERRTRIVKAIAQARPTASPMDLAESLAKQLGGKSTEYEDIVLVLASLYRTRQGLGLSKDEMVQEVVSTAKSLLERDDAAVDWAALERDVSQALDMHVPLGISSKAHDLATSFDQVMVDATIYTDIRPIFSPEQAPTLDGAVVVHQLKIVSVKNDQQIESFFAMDSSDLESLSRAINRALAKERVIATALDKTGIMVLELNGEPKP